MPTYKVVLEIDSNCDVDRVQTLLSELLSPDVSEIDGCDHWASKVLAVAETQSSRQGGPAPSE